MLESISCDIPMPTGDLALGLDLGAALAQLLPARGAVGQPDLGPHALAVVARVRHPAGAVGVVLVRRRVQAAAPAQVDLLAEALLGLLADVGEVDHAGLELRQRADERREVVPGARGDLRLQPRGDRRDLDVVDGHLHADLATPVLREAVEPLVVARHEVAPDEDLQLTGELLRRVGELLRRRTGAARARAAAVVAVGPSAARQHERRRGSLNEPATRDHERPSPLGHRGLPSSLVQLGRR